MTTASSCGREYHSGKREHPGEERTGLSPSPMPTGCYGALYDRKARQSVAHLRQKTLGLPCQEVGEIVEMEGNECDFDAGKQ